MAANSGSFKKGHSGGPGRPKVNFNLREEAGKHAAAALATLVAAMTEAPLWADRQRAAKELLDRGFGTAVQHIAGEGDGPIQVIIKQFTAKKPG